jgi:hypothetical protein
MPPDQFDRLPLDTTTTGVLTSGAGGDTAWVAHPRSHGTHFFSIPTHGVGLLALMLAVAIWLPVVHLLFAERTDSFHADTGVAPQARALARRHHNLWKDPALRRQECVRMRGTNAEWDFMGPTHE